jgi:hypothetical protein
MEPIVQSIAASTVSAWILSTEWLWPLLEIAHFVGLALLLGPVLIVDLRLAGLLRQIALPGLDGLVRWSIVGFALNVASGILFFLGDPARYWANVGFRIKMLLVLIAGLNVAVYAWKVRPRLAVLDTHGVTSVLARGIAWTSLATWTGVLLLGRLIPYVGTG